MSSSEEERTRKGRTCPRDRRILQAGARRGGASVESTAPQVVGDDDIRDGIEDELDVVGVGGAGDVSVDLLVGRLVLALVLGLDVRHRLRESVGACGRAESKGQRAG